MRNSILLSFLLIAILGKAQPFLVGHTQITYTDPARAGRSIQTEIYYPAATAGTSVPVLAGTYPVIVFGHGFVMAWDAYQNFWDDLVPQGYIIAFPRTEGSISPSHDEFGKDLKFLVSKLQNESATNAASLFYNHINAKSAIMGHSMGGGSAFLAAESNTAITTMVTFAAANTTPPSIDAATNVTVPTLVFSGENDCVAPPVSHQVPMYDSLASSCKAFVSVKGGAHCEFANSNFNCSFGQSTCSPSPTITRTQQQDVVSDLLKLWLEYYLKDNCTSWDVFNDSLSVSPRITHQQQCLINAPVITNSGSVLTSTPAATYQWYLSGGAIPGAISQTYTAVAPGNYYVEVTYLNACPYPSNTINITATGTNEDTAGTEVFVYPNPAGNFISVGYSGSKGNKIIANVLDALGRNMSHQEVESASSGVLTFDLSGLDAGLYFVEVVSRNGRMLEKLIKQ